MPAHRVYGLFGGYQTKLFNRTVGFSVNVNNVFAKDVYRQRALTSAVWDPGRTYRFSANVRF